MNSINNLSNAIKIKTVSYRDKSKIDYNEYLNFISFLKENYPLVHSALELTIINEYSLVYKWLGSKNTKLPTMFMAHYDVVPVELGTDGDWTFNAFSGEVTEDRIWGRGTLDIKSQLIAILEAVEELLSQKFQPQNDIYLCFGHDEEIGGLEGALKIVEYLQSKNIIFDSIYDEGGAVITGAIKGVTSPMAVVGVAEKGYCDIKISVNSTGGHSSTPPKNTSLGILAKIISEIEKKPMKSKICPPVLSMLKNVAPEMGAMTKFTINNYSLFKPIVNKILSKSPTTNAMLKTTIAFTMANASDAPNVLPQASYCILNSRIIPGDTSKDLIAHIKQVTDKFNATVEILELNEPSNISPINTDGYTNLSHAIGELFPKAIISPYLMLGGSDSRKYQDICKNIYRFSPYQITSEEQDTIHNTNESITIENFTKMIEFYKKMIQRN